MRTGRNSLRGLIILSAGVGCAGVLIAVALPLRDWIVEGSRLWTVEKGAPGEQARALAWLLERGSIRAVPHLLDQILDPALERRLEATDAYVRAGAVLAKRNTSYLKKILANAIAPPNCRYWQAILLARAGSVEAVPLLVSEVHRIDRIDRIDREMFEHIGRLAQPRHRELIDTLPGRVRPEQADDARAAVRRFEERFPLEERSP